MVRAAAADLKMLARRRRQKAYIVQKIHMLSSARNKLLQSYTHLLFFIHHRVYKTAFSFLRKQETRNLQHLLGKIELSFLSVIPVSRTVHNGNVLKFYSTTVHSIVAYRTANRQTFKSSSQRIHVGRQFSFA
jgi:hypothetical protein